MTDGILIVDKPAGITSHDVVARCRRILKTKRIGHTGTLDPFATGVVVILVGRATRLAQFLDKDRKDYEAVVRLGFETETGDLTGELRTTNYELRNVSVEEIEETLKEFRGEIWQTPPMYSAKKVEGKKLYELARKGIEIERRAVKITNYELRITNYELQKQDYSSKHRIQDFGLKVSCSAGTYIRVLAEDIGKKLRTGAHLAALRRTGAGKFDLSQSVTLERLEEIAAENNLAQILISMNDALSHLPEIKLGADGIKKIQNGMKLKLDSSEFDNEQAIRLTDESANLIAVGFFRADENFVQPKIVLV